MRFPFVSCTRARRRGTGPRSLRQRLRREIAATLPPRVLDLPSPLPLSYRSPLPLPSLVGNPTGTSDCEKRQPVTCTTPPTEADFPNLDEASVASCTGTFPGGACSSAKCKKGYYVDPAGLLTCLGAPTEVWERSSFTCLSTPSPPVPPSPPLAPPRSPGYKFNIKEGGCELTFLDEPPFLSSNCPIKYRADGTQQSIDGYNAPAAPPADASRA